MFLDLGNKLVQQSYKLVQQSYSDSPFILHVSQYIIITITIIIVVIIVILYPRVLPPLWFST